MSTAEPLPPPPETEIGTGAPIRLTVDHQHAPTGVAVPRPALSWVLPGTSPATAYEVEVDRLDPVTGEPSPVWATGRTEVSQTPGYPWVRYGGAPLAPDTDYAWRVRVWTPRQDDPSPHHGNPAPPDPGDTPSPWAESSFSTSLLPGADLSTPWVEPAQEPIVLEPATSLDTLLAGGETTPPSERLHPVRLIRQPLELATAEHGPVRRARLYTSAQGVIEVSLDGAPVGDTVLAPGWTSYQHYTELEVHDVTQVLAAAGAPGTPATSAVPEAPPRTHVLGITLGDGWFGGRITITGESAQYGRLLRAWWQLSLTYADGTRHTLLPSTCARSTGTGPLRYSDILIGEHRDDRLAAAVAGWDCPGFDDTSWEPVRLVAPTDLDTPTALEPFRGEPVRRLAALKVQEVVATPAGETVLDFGQVVAGRVRLSAVGPAGTAITLEHSEHLAADGTFFSNVQGPNKDQRDTWVLAGTGTGTAPEVYEPTFTFHGFRYVKVTGYPGEIGPADALAVVIGSDLEPTGTFACSDERLNRLHSNTEWSQRANFLAVPTDCPQRERVGWTGDIQVFAPAATNNAEVHSFLARWLRNLRADQHDDGRVPIISPWPPRMASLEGGGGLGSITAAAGWGDAIIRVPLALWERYGDPDTLQACYEAMVAWVGMQSRQAATELPPRLRGGPTPPGAAARSTSGPVDPGAGGPAAPGTDPVSGWESSDRTAGWDRLDEEAAARQRLLWNSRLHFGDWLAPSTLEPVAAAPVTAPPAPGTAPAEPVPAPDCLEPGPDISQAATGPDAEPYPDARPADPIMVAPVLTSEFVGAAFHAEALRTLATVCDVLGRGQEASTYRQRWQRARAAVAQEYIGPDGSMRPDLQGMYVLALALDLVPRQQREAVASHLVRLVEAAGHHLDTGFLSVPFLLDVLEETGRTDLAWALLLQDTAPSWLYEVEEGATTIWESWTAVAPDGTVGAMSLNHYAFGAVDDWMFRRLVGIEAAEPGFQRVRVAPLVDGPLTWAEGSRLTPWGEVRVRWERTTRRDGTDGAPQPAVGSPVVTYVVTLPAGVSGELAGPDGTVRQLGSGTTITTLRLPVRT